MPFRSCADIQLQWGITKKWKKKKIKGAAVIQYEYPNIYGVLWQNSFTYFVISIGTFHSNAHLCSLFKRLLVFLSFHSSVLLLSLYISSEFLFIFCADRFGSFSVCFFDRAIDFEGIYLQMRNQNTNENDNRTIVII